MANTKRATVYLDAPLHRALRLKSAETDSSISELVNAAVRYSLAEDADDLAAFRTWFAEYDDERWDQEMTEDAAAGRLDFLVKEVRDEIQRRDKKRMSRTDH